MSRWAWLAHKGSWVKSESKQHQQPSWRTDLEVMQYTTTKPGIVTCILQQGVHLNCLMYFLTVQDVLRYIFKMALTYLSAIGQIHKYKIQWESTTWLVVRPLYECTKPFYLATFVHENIFDSCHFNKPIEKGIARLLVPKSHDIILSCSQLDTKNS